MAPPTTATSTRRALSFAGVPVGANVVQYLLSLSLGNMSPEWLPLLEPIAVGLDGEVDEPREAGHPSERAIHLGWTAVEAFYNQPVVPPDQGLHLLIRGIPVRERRGGASGLRQPRQLPEDGLLVRGVTQKRDRIPREV